MWMSWRNILVPAVLSISVTVVAACQQAPRDQATACVNDQAMPSFHLERVLAAPEVLPVLNRGLLGFAPLPNRGLVILAGVDPHTLWAVDSLGHPIMIPVADSVWWNYPEVMAVVTTPAAVMLWEGATGTVVALRPDGQLESAVRVAAAAGPLPRIGPAGDLYLELPRYQKTSRIIHVPTPLGESTLDTIALPESTEGRKFATARSERIRVNQRVPFYPEPVWGPLPGEGIGWSDGARHVVYRVTGQSDSLVICDPGRPRAPVSVAEREENEAIITWSNRYTDSTWSYVGPRVPAVHAAIVGIGSDRDGRILLTVPTESLLLSEDQAWSMNPDDSMTPLRRFEPTWAIEMYTREGEPLGRFALPPGVDYRLWTLDGNTVWALREERRSGTYELVRYRLVAG
jgi:hypothetical protein